MLFKSLSPVFKVCTRLYKGICMRLFEKLIEYILQPSSIWQQTHIYNLMLIFFPNRIVALRVECCREERLVTGQSPGSSSRCPVHSYSFEILAVISTPYISHELLILVTSPPKMFLFDITTVPQRETFRSLYPRIARPFQWILCWPSR